MCAGAEGEDALRMVLTHSSPQLRGWEIMRLTFPPQMLKVYPGMKVLTCFGAMGAYIIMEPTSRL